MRRKLPRQSQKPGGEPQKAETPCGLGNIPAAAASVILATQRYRILYQITAAIDRPQLAARRPMLTGPAPIEGSRTLTRRIPMTAIKLQEVCLAPQDACSNCLSLQPVSKWYKAATV